MSTDLVYIRSSKASCTDVPDHGLHSINLQRFHKMEKAYMMSIAHLYCIPEI